MLHLLHRPIRQAFFVVFALLAISLSAFGYSPPANKVVRSKGPFAEPPTEKAPDPMPSVGETVYIGEHYRVANYLNKQNAPAECQLLGAEIAYDETIENFARVVVVKNGGLTKGFANTGPVLCEQGIKVLLPLGVLQMEYRAQLRKTEEAARQEDKKKTILDLLQRK